MNTNLNREVRGREEQGSEGKDGRRDGRSNDGRSDWCTRRVRSKKGSTETKYILLSHKIQIPTESTQRGNDITIRDFN